MDRKKKSVWVTVLVNLILIAAIAAVGWKIYDYLNEGRETTELAENLWEEAVITSEPATKDNTIRTGDAAPVRPGGPQGSGEKQDAAAATNAEAVMDTEAITDAAAVTDAAIPARESEAAPKTTPGSAESNGDARRSVFLDMQEETATPPPAPRFTDSPEIPAGIDFEKLKKTNKETAAWLYHPDMKINLPVVHTKDNEYYLSHAFTRYTHKAGTLFIDYRNKGDFSDRNTIIYGHARRDQTMFGRLHYYKKEEYCKEHPFFYLYVPGHRYRLEIVASIDTRDASDYYDLPAGEYWDELLDKAIERTAFDFGIPVSPDDHYVTLSTCAYDYQEERWLVIARIDDPEGTLPPLE